MRRHRGVMAAAVAASLAVPLAAPPSAAAETAPSDPAGAVVTRQIELESVDRSALGTLAVPTQTEPEAAGAAPFAVSPDVSDQEDAGAELAVLTRPTGTGDFDLVGVTWPSGADVERVLVRVRQDGLWSSWLPLEEDGTTPEAGTAEAKHAVTGTEPLVRPGSDGLQVRVETADGKAPEGLAATVVDGDTSDDEAAPVEVPGTLSRAVSPVEAPLADSSDVAAQTETEATDVAAAGTTAAISPAGLAPRIVTRAQWGADESIRKPIDWNSTIKAVVVHHTVNANDYTQAQAPAIVRSIYAYHVRSRGWSDVGYHFLVDRFGTVYEGRKGSIDRIPLGVHTGGFNTSTIGVAMIGEYGSAVPSMAAMRSVAQVAAWKLATFGRDPLGTTVLTARSGSTRQPPGWSGAVNVISGHRDLATTACPGQLLYNRLATIRSLAAAQVARTVLRPVTSWAQPGGPVALTHYTPSTAAWTASVRPACSATVTRTFTGTGSRWARVAWDGRTSTGAQAFPGVYQITVTRTVGSVAYQDSRWVEIVPPAGSGVEHCGVSRWGGSDRSGTAAMLGTAAFPTSTEVVIVAGGAASVVDGLVAAPFARTRLAPMLLSNRDALAPVTRAEIERRAPRTAWLIGGTGVLGTTVVDELRALGVTDVRRLSGADRFGTADAVALAIGPSPDVVVASSAQGSLIDSAVVGGAAAALRRPILLTTPTGPTDGTKAVLRTLGARRVTVVGGEGVVPPAAATAFGAETGSTPTRYGGADRYATAAAVADGFAAQVGTDRVLVASGANVSLVDAITGGVLGRLTLLVPGAGSTPATDGWLNRNGTTHVDIAGGAGVVQPAAVAALIGAMN